MNFEGTLINGITVAKSYDILEKYATEERIYALWSQFLTEHNKLMHGKENNAYSCIRATLILLSLADKDINVYDAVNSVNYETRADKVELLKLYVKSLGKIKKIERIDFMKRKLFMIMFVLAVFIHGGVFAAEDSENKTVTRVDSLGSAYGSKVVTTVDDLGLAVKEAFDIAEDDVICLDLYITVNEDVKNFLKEHPSKAPDDRAFKIPNSATLNNRIYIDLLGMEPDGENYKCPLLIRFFEHKKDFKEIMDLEKYIKKQTQGMTDLQKVDYLNNYLARKLKYDYTYTTANAITAAKRNVAMCAGYADMFQILGESAGLKVGCMSSDLMKHRWNYVLIGDKKYYIDATWNDIGSSASKEYFSLKPIHQKEAPDQYVSFVHQQ